LDGFAVGVVAGDLIGVVGLFLAGVLDTGTVEAFGLAVVADLALAFDCDGDLALGLAVLALDLVFALLLVFVAVFAFAADFVFFLATIGTPLLLSRNAPCGSDAGRPCRDQPSIIVVLIAFSLIHALNSGLAYFQPDRFYVPFLYGRISVSQGKDEIIGMGNAAADGRPTYNRESLQIWIDGDWRSAYIDVRRVFCTLVDCFQSLLDSITIALKRKSHRLVAFVLCRPGLDYTQSPVFE
jgi:hypothetical protein